MNTRKATLNDLDTIMDMIVKGREHIHEFKIKQWTNGYPSSDLIKTCGVKHEN